MNNPRGRFVHTCITTISLMILFITGCSSSGKSVSTDPLPSWNEGAAKQSIITFVEKVTKEGSSDFVPIPERIAVFDNDGTLWTEKPLVPQAAFLFERIFALAPAHPEWQSCLLYTSPSPRD